MFENSDKAPLALLILPWGDTHHVPHLAAAGIRYSLSKGAEDRCHSVVSAGAIEFWCSADSYEIDIVPPLPSDTLAWEICAEGGWCGGAYASFRDLLPASGIVTASDFAKLVHDAEGGSSFDPLKENHVQWLTARFVKHLGALQVDAEALRQTARRPFDDQTC